MRQREDRAWGVGAPASCHTQRRSGMGEDGEQKPEGGWMGPDAAGHSSDPDLTQSDGQSKRGESRDTAKLNTQPSNRASDAHKKKCHNRCPGSNPGSERSSTCAAECYGARARGLLGQRGDWPQYIGDGISGAWPLEKDKGLPVTRQATWPSAGKERGK